jgi:hypothetical protein
MQFLPPDLSNGAVVVLNENKQLINLATSYGAVGKRAPKLWMLDATALVMLLRNRGAPSSMVKAVKAATAGVGTAGDPGRLWGDEPLITPLLMRAQRQRQQAAAAATTSLPQTTAPGALIKRPVSSSHERSPSAQAKHGRLGLLSRGLLYSQAPAATDAGVAAGRYRRKYISGGLKATPSAPGRQGHQGAASERPQMLSLHHDLGTGGRALKAPKDRAEPAGFDPKHIRWDDEGQPVSPVKQARAQHAAAAAAAAASLELHADDDMEYSEDRILASGDSGQEQDQQVSGEESRGWDEEDPEQEEDNMDVMSLLLTAFTQRMANATQAIGSSNKRPLQHDSEDSDGSESEAAELRRAFRAEAKEQAKRDASDLRSNLAAFRGQPTGKGAPAATPAARIHLKDEELSQSTKTELQVLYSVLQDPYINLLRHRVAKGRLADATVNRLKKDIMRYFGFLHHVLGWRLRDISLSAYTEVKSIQQFLAHLEGRGVRATELLKHLSTATKVSYFLSNLVEHNTGSPVSQDTPYMKAVSAYAALQDQVGAIKNSDRGSRPEACMGRQGMPDAPAALAFVESVVDKSLSGAEQYVTDDRDLPLPVARSLRDACMMGMAVGHVGLAVRVSTIRTVKSQYYAHTACTHSGCTIPGCKGNRLELSDCKVAGGTAREQQVSPGSDSDQGGDGEQGEADVSGAGGRQQLQLILWVPHHKTSGRGVVTPPIPILSLKLRRLLQLYELRGRPVLVQAASHKTGYVEPQNLFLNDHGDAYSKLSDWSKRVHADHQAYSSIASVSAVPSLRDYRSIMITDRMEHPERPGPEPEGAAIIMGNSQQAWEQHYWKTKRLHQAGKAAEAQGAYRESCLAEARARKLL